MKVHSTYHIVWEEDTAFNIDAHLSVPTDSFKLTSSTPMGDVHSIVSPYLVKPGAQCVDTANPLFLCTLCATTEGFALIFSISHMLVDGHSFYQLYGMLSKSSEVQALNAARKDEAQYVALSKEMHGERQMDWLASPFTMVGMIRNMFFRPACQVTLRLVDMEYIKMQKREHIATSSAAFISTNDILTSWFFGTMNIYGVMAVNHRPRFAMLSEDDAGNYEGLIHFRPSQSCSADIRASLGNGAQPQALLGKCESTSGKFTLATNWATFFREVYLPGACHVIHFPVVSPEGIPFDSFMVIFKADKSKLALAIFSRGAIDARVLNSVSRPFAINNE